MLKQNKHSKNQFNGLHKIDYLDKHHMHAGYFMKISCLKCSFGTSTIITIVLKGDATTITLLFEGKCISNEINKDF